MGYDSVSKCYSVVGEWDPRSESFEVLNDETPKGTYSQTVFIYHKAVYRYPYIVTLQI